MLVWWAYIEIHEKFEELEWRQRLRVQEGTTANDESHRWALETGPEAKARNRYMNVLVWANSRIHLRVPEGECDFINASPILLKDSTSGEERRYIATQVSSEFALVPSVFANARLGSRDGTDRVFLEHGFPREQGGWGDRNAYSDH